MILKSLIALLTLVAGLASHAAEPFVLLDREEATRLSDASAYQRPTLVALWSLDCVHCKKNLQLLSALARTSPNLALITVAVEPAHEALAEPLDRLEVPGRRFAFGGQSPESLSYALDSRWRGELPRTLLFDGRGGRHAVSGVLSEDEVRRLLGLEP